MRTKGRDNGLLHYQRHGSISRCNGAAEPLVLHGGTGTLDADSGWGRLLPRLAARYRVVAAEHRGHGRSDTPAGRLGYDLLLDDLWALNAALGLAPAHIAGMRRRRDRRPGARDSEPRPCPHPHLCRCQLLRRRADGRYRPS